MNSQSILRRIRVAGLVLVLALVALMAASSLKAQDAVVQPAAVDVPGEILVFDWKTPVTKLHRGFPWDRPPKQNGNWVSPVNYAGGNFYFRVQVFSQPKPQNMRLQFCVWQFRNTRETCSALKAITVGQTVTWSQPVNGMWKKNGVSLNWTKPRDRNGVAIKNSAGKPVSNYSNWNWNGENPDLWYPLNMRFTVVAVRQGKAFSGWQNYIP